MASDPPGQLLAQAISAAYGHDVVTQQQANQWLHQFASTPEAWAAALALVEPGTPPEHAFFAANMLLSKTRSEWGKLQPHQQQELAATYRSAMARHATAICMHAARQPSHAA